MLKPVVARYQGTVSRIYFRADAGFANPGVYDFLEAECMKYAIRLPANPVLQDGIGYLFNRPVGRSPNASRAETPITRRPALARFLASLLRQLFL